MKLKESFMTSDTIDYFMGLLDGANYVVLYQMLCLKTINTEGRFERQIGAVLIPYDIEKIRRDTKWFSADTIRVALNLYKQFGLIYEDVNGVLVIANHKNLVGSETDWAEKKNRQRLNPGKTRLPSGDIGGDNVPSNVPTENRDKNVENREQSIDTRDESSEDYQNNNLNNNNPDDDEKAVNDFSVRSGASLDAYLGVNELIKKRVKKLTQRLFDKAVGKAPTAIDESKVYCYISDLDCGGISNDRIYILTCAFYKAAERGQVGNWYYIESILSDMQAKGIRTKDEAVDYFYSRKGES